MVSHMGFMFCRRQYHSAPVIFSRSIPFHKIILHLLILIIVYVKIIHNHLGAAQRQLKPQSGILVEAHFCISKIGARRKIGGVQLLDFFAAAI